MFRDGFLVFSACALSMAVPSPCDAFRARGPTFPVEVDDQPNFVGRSGCSIGAHVLDRWRGRTWARSTRRARRLCVDDLVGAMVRGNAPFIREEVHPSPTQQDEDRLVTLKGRAIGPDDRPVNGARIYLAMSDAYYAMTRG
jgi:hypothetical protein